MTDPKGVRVPEIQCSSISFKQPVSLFKTDVVELDFDTRRARVVNRAGKVKASVPFSVEPYGPLAPTGG